MTDTWSRFDLPASTHGLPVFPNESQNSSRFPASPTPVPRPAPYRLFGKENGQPERPVHQRFRRAPSAPNVPSTPSQGYPPQMFLNPSSINPLYSHSYARSFGGFSQHAFAMTNVATGYGTTFQGDFKPLGAMLQPQQQQGQGMGSKNNGFGSGTNYNL